MISMALVISVPWFIQPRSVRNTFFFHRNKISCQLKTRNKFTIPH